MSRSSMKTMLIVFFDIRGIAHREFVPQGQAVNTVLLQSSAAFEGEHSVKAIGSVAVKELDSPRRQCTLSLSTPRSLVSCQPQHVITSAPTLLARFSSCRLFLFPKIKMQLKGYRSHTVAEIQCESQRLMDSLKQNYFEAAFQQWQECCDRCTAAQGDYFEGDVVQT
jgi:hypothetical protein